MPSTDTYGDTLASVVRCSRCGHGSLVENPDAAAVLDAYSGSADEVSLREEAGQVATAHRALDRIERWQDDIRSLVDLGCWTGSLLVAATERGWRAEGVEPSRWAAERARSRGCRVQQVPLEEAVLAQGSFSAAVFGDVLEHLAQPARAVELARHVLRPSGVLYLTVPDAGSVVARVLGRRWWSVLPMHLQYFTRDSMRLLLETHGFEVLDVATHPKTFSRRYYAERVASLVPGLAGRDDWSARLPRNEALVSPDLRDRMVVIARR